MAIYHLVIQGHTDFKHATSGSRQGVFGEADVQTSNHKLDKLEVLIQFC